MIRNNELVLELDRFIRISGPWNIFFNVTFRKKTPMLKAKKAFKYFFKYLNKSDKIFFGRLIYCCVFFEQDTRGGVHIHALIRGIHPSLANALEAKCKRFFGRSVVRPFDPDRDASLYLASKYTTASLTDFTFMKINSNLRLSFDNPMILELIEKSIIKRYLNGRVRSLISLG